ncbi:ketoacyl-ACP synthase III [Nocardioides marmoriginsengisoli]|uniref:Beta-ketoacyl-[acyl-carrier-protein] synthase III n=1 Tax=Nocardioides marmoriginsengisoli TaxID=661483 RepID=A0A3N0CNE8_9ACTN|nr:beta-ketoacyl-ACP synthase III [Nocardioides marmoriginsengisoli]RNL64433.1 ketoacyl-ACP synthase III [Nocardioides marmoriginsengisoli]
MPAGSPHAAVLGLGIHRAKRVVPNAEIIDAIDSSDEWIQQRSGIKERRWVGPGETLESMSFAAAERALEASGIAAAQIDAVILASCSNTQQITALAPRIAHLLGTQSPAAFDISIACAGFCHGLSLATDMIRGGTSKHVLVIGAELFSPLVSEHDRGTAFIFGDGAGAVVVGPSDVPGIGPVVWGSDGEQHNAIELSEDWVAAMTDDEPVLPHITMDGPAVFRWAAFEMAKVAQETLDRTGITVDDLDLFVPHQANMRITDAMARAMKLPDRVRIARDIAEQGNTSAASIPLALGRMYEDGEAKSGDLALLIAFGAGLAYAAQVIRIP